MDPFTVASSQLDALMHKLTPRQLQVVGLLAQGHGYGEICSILSIERVTLQKHIRDACQRIEAENKMQLVVMFVLWKIIETKE